MGKAERSATEFTPQPSPIPGVIHDYAGAVVCAQNAMKMSLSDTRIGAAVIGATFGVATISVGLLAIWVLLEIYML
jgi:hypothetical protein